MNKFSLPIAHQALLFSIALSSSRREYRTATAALEAAQPQRSTRLHQNALQHDALRRNKPLRPSTLSFVCNRRQRCRSVAPQIPKHAVFRTSHAKIHAALAVTLRGETMDLFTIVIIAAMLITVAVMFLGVLAMSGGGATDATVSTPLMWLRVGFQALTILLLIIAIQLR